MTWNYESFWVHPYNFYEWHKRYPKVENRWILRVVFDRRAGKWQIVEGDYSAIMHTRLDQVYLDERFERWQDAVERAHELVSTVATSHQGLTWPQAKSRIECEEDPVLF